MASRSSRAAASATVQEASEPDAKEPEVVPLVLRRVENPPRRHVEWSGDTVDNEHLDKKSSKICCVYHKPKAFDESSDESDYEQPPADYRRYHHPRPAPEKPPAATGK